MTESAYLQCLESRTRAEKVKLCAASGVVAGSVLLGLGLYFYYLVPYANDRLWRFAFEAGALILFVTLIAPTLLAPIELVMRKVGHFVFHTILLALLVVLYVLFLIPIGVSMRKNPPAAGWVPKVIRQGRARSGEKKRSVLLLPFFIISYFVQERRYVLVPLVVLMLIAGLALLFLQTSALAPFIYTLF